MVLFFLISKLSPILTQKGCRAKENQSSYGVVVKMSEAILKVAGSNRVGSVFSPLKCKLHLLPYLPRLFIESNFFDNSGFILSHFHICADIPCSASGYKMFPRSLSNVQ